LVTAILSMGLVTTIGFAATPNIPDSLNPVTLNTINQSVPVSALIDNPRADNPRVDNSGTTGSKAVLVSAANTSNTRLAAVDSPASKQSNSKNIPKDIPQSWLDQVQKDIAQREYHITWQDKTDLPNNKPAWQAPNRAHDFRTYFTGNGLTVVPRSGAKDWLWSLKLIAYGDEQTNSQAKPEVKDNQITYQHSAKLKEWYINNAQGLEQGFTLNAPANNHKNNQQSNKQNTLKLDFQLGGSLTATLTNNKQTISLKDKNQQQRFTFGKLKVIDANNKTLKSHFELDKQTQILTLVTDASNAVYPITVDPVLSGASPFLESNQADAVFGSSVASAGDVNGDGYGDVIIGAFRYDNGQFDEGAVFVYLGSVNGLSSSSTWFAEGNQVSAFFGWSVASAGNVNGDMYGDVIIGVRFYSNLQSNEGAVFVYLGSSTGLTVTVNPGAGPSPLADWNAEGNQVNGYFGESVASAGNVNGDAFGDVIIGAPLYDNGETNEGAVFVYLGSSTGLTTTVNPGAGPSPVADWSAESNQALAQFGVSVASAGNVNGDAFGDVIIGADNYDNGESGEGAAFVYLGSAGGLNSSVAWTAESNQVGGSIGGSVASAGDVNGDGFGDVIVGSDGYDNGETNEGAAFLYLGSSMGLTTTVNPGAGPSPLADWIGEGNQANARFGESVASAGDINGDGYDDVIIGAFWYNNGERIEGAAFVYLGTIDGLSPSAAWFADGNQASARFGTSVASAGDVNGDGYGDVIIGSDGYDNGETDEGAAFVYLGTANGLSPGAAWTAESNQVNAQFGYSVASAGDVNGDGFGDIIIGAPLYDSGQTTEGAVFVYMGSSTGMSAASNQSADWFAESNQFDARFGVSVASAGDVNGDGFGDVIIGARYYESSIADFNEGAAFIYLGSSLGLKTTINLGSGLNPSADWSAEGNKSFAQFGRFVASAGDVNGDGYGDVIIGAPIYENGESSEGAAFVYLGSNAGTSTTADWFAEGNQMSANFGWSVASAGDVNGDGFNDVIIGTNQYANGETAEGAAFVYLGSSLGLSNAGNTGIGPNPLADWSAESNKAGARFGISVNSAGDVNGDGYGDIIVSTLGGPAFVYQGSSTGLTNVSGSATEPNPIADWSAESKPTTEFFSSSVASAGDVNGDGYGDVIIGADRYRNGETDEGAVHVYLGSNSGLTTTINSGTGPSPLADWTAESNQAGSQFGRSIAGVGDINGDGYGDVIVGAHLYGRGQSNEGVVGVYDLTPPLAPFTQNGSYNIIQRLVGARPDGSTLIPACGLSDRRDSFQLQVIRNNAAPNATLQLEWEVKANGVAFDGVTTISASPVTYLGSGTTIIETVTGLSPNTAYRWRARVLENNIAGPWLRVLNHDVQGCDVRTYAESNLALSVSLPAVVALNHEFDVVYTIDNNVAPANGPDQAQDVKLEFSDIMSTYSFQRASIVDPSSANIACAFIVGAGRGNCTISKINPGTSTIITLTYSATVQGSNSFTSIVSQKNYDPDLANNTDTYNITVTPPVGVTLNPMTNFVTDENKLMVSRSVVLNGPPDGTVTIPVASSNTDEGTIFPSVVTFTSADWNIPKPISVHGVPDVDPLNPDAGNVGYVISLTPSSTVALDNTQIGTAVITLNGTNNSTTPNLQSLVPDIPRAQSPGYDAKNIPAGNVSLRWNKVTSPGGLPVTYTVKICKDDVTLSGGCVAVPVLTSENTGFSPMLYASFGGSSLLFLGLMNTRIRRRWVLVLVTVAVASSLVSCGGGGGSDLPPSAPPEADTMGTTVSLVAGTWYWQVVASDGGTLVASEVMIFTVQ